MAIVIIILFVFNCRRLTFPQKYFFVKRLFMINRFILLNDSTKQLCLVGY